MRMLISQTPVRLSMGGGGTDVAAYYEKYGGFWTSAAINQFVYVTVNSRHDDTYVIKYSNVSEQVTAIEEIKHDIIREALSFMNFDSWHHPLFRTRGLEINITSDVQGKSGLGVSGAITVGLLSILHQLKGESYHQAKIAEEACHVERDLVGSKSTGKQDQYIAAYGGITSFDVDTEGNVTAAPLDLDRHTLSELGDNIVLFGTRLKRRGTAEEALQKVTKQLETKSDNADNAYAEYLHRIKQIGIQQRDALLARNPDEFGVLLDTHWEVKKQYSDHTDEAIDRAYELAKKAGVLGGKVIGASSQGAYMMFYCTHHKEKLRPIMEELDMIEIPWSFEFSGSRIIHIH
jgi:D-glycero-alpha-D-manno-heptose-7-phosphate kinase